MSSKISQAEKGSSQQLVLLDDDEVRQAITAREAIKVVGEAFVQLHTKDAQVPLRTGIATSEPGAATFFMPARVAKTGALGIKLVSVRPSNAGRGLPTVPAVVMLLDEPTGLPATQLTAIRTAAGSAVATNALAKKNAHVMVVFGVGEQAQAHIEAICTVRSIKEVYLINRTKSKALDLQQRYQAAVGHGYTEITWHVVDKDSEGTHHPSRCKVVIRPASVVSRLCGRRRCVDENKAVSRADIIVTATNSSKPIFNGKYLKPGVHINAIGSYSHSMQELDETTVQSAKIVVDNREAALKEAGDIVVPLEKGLITTSSIVAELGQVLAEEMEVRQSDEDITLFKSVGNAVQDVSVAHAVFLAAQKRGLGERIAFNPTAARL